MARYSIGVVTAATAAGAPIVALRASATERLYLKECGFFPDAATVSAIGLIRAAAVGTATASALGQPEDPGDTAGTGNVDTTWSTAPTIAATPLYLRRIRFPANVGAGVIWTFPERGLVVPAGGALLAWNYGAAANPVLNAYFVWDA